MGWDEGRWKDGDGRKGREEEKHKLMSEWEREKVRREMEVEDKAEGDKRKEIQ